MDISALDRGVTDRTTPNAPLASAEGDLFNQMLAGLTEGADPYSDEDPVDDEAAEEPADNKTAAPDKSEEQTNQQLASLGQPAVVPESAPVVAASKAQTPKPAAETAGTSDGDDAGPHAGQAKAASQTGGAEQPAAPAAADTAKTAVIAAQSPEAAAVSQPVTQQAMRQAGKEQPQQNTPVDPAASPAGQISLRAGRDEVLNQGNGQFHTAASNTDTPDKAAPSPTDAPDEQLTQTGSNGDRPVPKAEVAQQVPRPETPALEIPKTLTPPPSSPFAASIAPTANAPLDQAGQVAANGRAGDAQSIAAAKQSSVAKGPAEARQPPAQQVAIHVRNGIKAGADSIHVRLNPAELGRVEVRLQIDSDKIVQTVVTVEKAETLESLQRDARTLQRALEDAGFKSDPDSFTFQHDQSTPNQGDQAQSGRRLAGGGDAAADGSDPQEVTIADRRSSHDGIVDIEV